MGKSALALVTTLVLLRSAAPVRAQTPSKAGGAPPPAATTSSIEATNRIIGYTGWDDDFLYVAVQVNKPNIVGKNTDAFSHPLEDDAVIVSVQSDNDHKATRRTEHTVSLAISAAHGAQLYLGADAAPLYRDVKEPGELLKVIAEKFKDNPDEQKKQYDAILNKIFKYEVQQKGIPRRDNSSAPGYTVELAIPWIDLGVKPVEGMHLGFNVVAQSRSAGSPSIQSLAPTVRGASDVDNPSLWTEIVLSKNAAPTSAVLVTVPRVPSTNRLELNGELTPGEWNGISVFEFGELATARTGHAALETTLAARNRLDFVPRPPRPVVPIAPPTEVNLAARLPQKITPLVLATYEYDYQADPRKAAPAAQVVRSDNASLLAHHPLDGAGPWFSFDRAEWHRKQLAEARREGIDVLLPVYRGSAHARQLYADKGIDVLVMALKSMRQSGQDYPQIGLFLDTNSLIEALGDRPDLHDPKALGTLYAMIRDYYRHIPAEFRCGVSMGVQNGGRMACPVFLSNADAIKDMDTAFVGELRNRFAADFPGSDLLVVGVDGFRSKATMDGFFATPTAKEGLPFGEGWLKIATVGAGYAASRTFEDKTLPARRDTDAYRTLWTNAIGKAPDWILLDGWNDYTNGREITPSVEAGFSLADTTLFLSRLFAGTTHHPLRLLGHDVPSTLAPGESTTVQLRLQNSGMEEWGGGKSALPTITYRWRGKNGIAATGGNVTLNAPVLAGQNVSISLPITAGNGKNSPLAAGDYTLEIAVGLPKGSGVGTPTCEIPVHIGGDSSASWAATVVKTDMPTLLENGGLYEVNATLRNDGSTTWRKADGVRVGVRLYSVNETANGQASAPLTTADASTTLDKDIAPGQLATVRLVLPITDPQGAPLPELESGSGYLARWEVAPAASPQAVVTALQPEPALAGVSVAPTPVALVDFDFGVRFTQDVTPQTLPAGKRLPVRMSLQNTGTQTWRRNQVRVGYHWYFQDGTEYFFENETTPITEDVSPGSQTQELLTWVTPPPTDGIYWLVWDVKFGDTWASTVAGTRVGDTVLHQIQVSGDRLVFADLTKSYNTDGVSDPENVGSAGFDSSGRSFPAALLPPFPDAPIAPAGMWLPTTKIGADSPRRIGFRWGPKEGKSKNMIACMGQKVDLSKTPGFCHLLHLVAASSGKEAQINVKLIFEEPTGTSEDLYSLTVSPWDHPGENKDEIAALTAWHNERDGAKLGAVALYHYTIKIRDPRKLIAIQLPLAPEVKIAAITLEK
ncbi:MAG: putative cellulase [Chthonomonadaceae bacterium]|nr:putative cellulase [Chthonomonadaceae bacterium]